MKRLTILVAITLLIMGTSGCKDIQNTDLSKQQDESSINLDEQNKIQNDEINISKTDEAISPIIFNNILLGGYHEGKWSTPSDVFGILSQKEIYKIYSLNSFIGEAAATEYLIDKENTDLVHIDVKPKEDISEYTAISCDWDALPRTPIKQSNESEVYEEYVKQILQDNGLTDDIPINIKQNIRVDFEGDGIDEVIIMAENVSPLTGYLKNNDYSFLVVRKLINNVVENIYIAKDIVQTDNDFIESIALTYTVKSIIDTNGDGIMELLVEIAYYEGVSYELYEIRNDGSNLLMSYGFGE